MASEANPSGNDNIAAKVWTQRMTALPEKFSNKTVDVILKLKKLGEEDPRRVIHSFKVGLAIILVSITFYYFDPLYQGFGSSAMWAVFTVIVITEFSVGATLGKGLNRGLATLLAGALGLGTHYLTNPAGNIGQPILIGMLAFALATGVTYLRFFPEIKARYDYGLLMFILTFCMVSLSSYRDDNILDIAQKRVITILVGGLISVLVCVFVYPIWAGDDLHSLVSKNIEKLAIFLEGFGDEYFRTSESGVQSNNKSSLQGYTSVLNSKQAEENFANFARWEPRHGRFKLHHPWKQYLKIGSLSRQCAYRIDALNGFLNSTKTTPEVTTKLRDPCIKMSTETGKALKELAEAMTKMVPPSSAQPHITKSKIGAMNLRCKLRKELREGVNLLEAIPAVTVSSLLVDVVSCTERLAESIEELSSQAKFKNKDIKVAPHLSTSPQHQDVCHNGGPHNVIITINQPPANSS